MQPFVRNPYNYDMDKVSEETGLKCLDKTRTQQQFKEESDINTIVERFHLTGQLPLLPEMPQFETYDGIFDFQTAMNAVRAGEEAFMSMPANIRARFHNDPAEFLEFCGNSDNIPEARKLGILAPEPPTTEITNATDPAKGPAPAPQTVPATSGTPPAPQTGIQPQKP